ncbi:hypothetical protein BDK51DRAFT_46823 [Blyttiomyces helicus]|uniref:Uncharacterized protein n=1 Tax=Blyttiomyces helicus TaxID=388810 RepID=A0A4P9W9R8_9FUNG|nr:hypothetical protein BDK51DRAFT_46823 [Blyttiomyces helicus]|eukprot:RKO88932.1 hypothetical protein BDK51DRAFT_46823 [Blyttiomyces helicus]
MNVLSNSPTRLESRQAVVRLPREVAAIAEVRGPTLFNLKPNLQPHPLRRECEGANTIYKPLSPVLPAPRPSLPRQKVCGFPLLKYLFSCLSSNQLTRQAKNRDMPPDRRSRRLLLTVAAAAATLPTSASAQSIPPRHSAVLAAGPLNLYLIGGDVVPVGNGLIGARRGLGLRCSNTEGTPLLPPPLTFSASCLLHLLRNNTPVARSCLAPVLDCAGLAHLTGHLPDSHSCYRYRHPSDGRTDA